MTFSETQKILFAINVAYPNYKPQADPAEVVKLWAAMLKEYPYSKVSAALETFIRTDASGFAPSISQIINIIHMSDFDTDMTAEEAWTLVNKAIQNSVYHAEEEFAKLPESVKRAVGSAENLRTLAQTDIETIQSVEKSHFIRTYNGVIRQEKIKRKIPDPVKQALGMNQKPKPIEEKKPDQLKLAAEPKPIQQKLPDWLLDWCARNDRKEGMR